MKVFLTGGTGFIGSRVLDQLLSAGHQVTALARSDRSAEQLANRGAYVARGDITDKDSILLRPLAPLVQPIEEILPRPVLFRSETLRILGTTYMATAAKAQRELGWTSRRLEAGMRETLDWLIEKEDSSALFTTRPRQIAGLALFSAFVLLLLSPFGRRRR